MTYTTLISLICFSIALVIVIILLSIGIWNLNKQPLKSRGLLPLLLTFSLGVSLTTKIIVLSLHYSELSEEIKNKALCYQRSFFDLPLRLASVYLIAYDALRYFVLNKINRDKEGIGENLKKEVTRDVTKYKILKFLTSGWALLCFYSSIVLVWDIVAVIAGFVYARVLATGNVFECPHTGNISQTGDIILLAMNIIGFSSLILCVLVVIIFDVMKNLKLLRECRFKDYFIYTDPFLFRVQYIIVVIALFWVVSTGLLYIILGSRFTLVLYVGTVSNAVLFLFAYLGVVYVLTIKWNWRKIDRDEDDIQRVFRNSQLRKLFKEFARREWFKCLTNSYTIGQLKI